MQKDDPRKIKDFPPRQLSLLSQLVILFGSGRSNMGWAVMAFGMIFVWGFTTFNTPIYWLKPFQNWETTSAKITKVSESNGSINDERIYQYDYNYEVNGQNYQGLAYTTGRQFEKGVFKEIEFNPDNPNQSIMEGTRRTLFGRWISAFASSFAAIGFFIFYSTFRKNWKYLKLLKNGDATRAELISKKRATAVRKDGEYTCPENNYEFEFEYTNTSGLSKKYIAKCKTHLRQKVEDELKEIVLFDRFNPEYNMVFDAMENAPCINHDGYFEQAPTHKTFTLLIPVLTILGHGYYYVFYVLLF